jgi:hypothetical protein
MNDYKFAYMLLSRYQSDIEYYFGYGNRCEKHLYHGNFQEHIRQTIELWKTLPAKPEWLRAKKLIEYKRRGTYENKQNTAIIN